MIDWSRVIALRDRAGTQAAAPMIGMILTEIEAHLSVLPEDGPTLAQDLPLLGTLARQIGFRDFGARCDRAVQQLAQGEGAALSIATLRASFGHSKQMLLRDLPHVIDGPPPEPGLPPRPDDAAGDRARAS